MSRTSKATHRQPWSRWSTSRLPPTLRSGAGAALGAGAVATALATVAAAAGRLHWTLDLFSHFALQLATAQVLLLLAFTLWRRRRAALILLPFLAINAAAVWPYVPRSGVALAADGGGPSGEAAVVAVNVAAHNFLFGGLRQTLRRERPDLVVVSEYTPRWAGRFRELAALYPFRFEHAAEGAGGIAVLSRHPLRDARLVDLGGRMAIDAVAAIGDEELRVVGVHLTTPVSAAGSRLRAAQLERLAELLRESPGRTVVLGDFNLSVYSPVYRAWLEATGFTDSLRGRGPDISWPTWLPLLGIPIDHCLVSGDLNVIEHRRLTDFGSDHYPVLARIRW
jgi:endonuclease/exonuclease/phosphatase (EEP) superfamily protein YafD